MSAQRGSALIIALFLIVVLAVLGSVAVRLTTVQGQTANLGLSGVRALNAARSGIEWGARRTLAANSCFSGATTMTEAALNGFTVTVDCTTSSHTEAGKTVQVYVLTAFASSGTYGQPGYVSRRIQAVIATET
ncbi:MAG: pilus assembly protein MshP [Gammaproteobacteria bacterium]|nr:pilus assembly protein MshP [Gammaproteobacteria bacterium]